MKKTITLLLTLVLISSVVLAQGKPEDAGQPETTGQPEDAGAEPQQIMVQEQTQEGEQARLRIQTGLANALTKVTNENARARIQANLDRWMEKYQERLQKLEDVEVDEVDEETGAVEVKAKEQVKYFGFIKGRATKRFNINAQGKIEEKAPWYRFMYAEVDEEE
jgi:hypothetical protein